MLDGLAFDFESIRKLCATAKTPEFRSELECLIRGLEEKFNQHLPPIPQPPATNPALDPDFDKPDNPTHELAQFGAGCFWGLELAFQRVVGVLKTEVGFSQGHLHDPTFKLVCSGTTNHTEVVRVHFDPEVCSYSSLLSIFWSIPNLIDSDCKPRYKCGQPNPKCEHYRSGIYYYNEAQCRLARASKEAKQAELKDKEFETESETETEILPAKRFYKAAESHQQFLAKGGSRGVKQSAEKGCSIPIRWYG